MIELSFGRAILECVLVGTLAVFVRLPFVTSYSSDSDWHLWKIQEARKTPRARKFRHEVSNALAPAWHVYANLQHIVLARFSRRRWLAAGKGLNIAYDVLTAWAVYVAAAWWWFPGEATPQAAALSAPGWTALLFATAPILFPVTARIRAIGARALGSFLGITYLLLLGLAVEGGHVWAAAGCFVLVLLSALASQFGLQTIVLFSVLLSLFRLSPVPVVVVALPLVVGWFVPALGIRRLLIGYADFYGHYWRTWQRGSTAAGRNQWSDLVSLPRLLRTKPGKAFKLCFEKLTPVIAILAMPVLLFWAVWIVSDPGAVRAAVTASSALQWALLVSLAGLVCFVATSIEPLVILGQAERYFTYAAPMVAALTTAYAWQTDRHGLLLWIFVVQLVAIFAHWAFIERDELGNLADRHLSPEFNEVVEFLRGQSGLRVICVPTKHAYRISSLLPDSDARFYYDHLTMKDGGRRYMAEERPYYAVLRGDLEYFVEKYGANTFVLRKDHIVKAARRDVDYGLSSRSPVLENDEYLVYRLGPDAQG